MNRNFQDFSKPLPVNDAYRALQPLLLPERWPPDAVNADAVAQYIQTHGMPAFQAAISRGQHEFPDGLFFGGAEPTWSNLTLRQVLRDWARTARRIAWIDLHTGIALEYGTLPMAEIMNALRAEHWLNNHPEAPSALAKQIKQQLMIAFYTDTDEWKDQIISQARQALLQAAAGLSS